MARRRFLHPPRRAFPTRAGWFVFVAPMVLGIAAVTASNNLLFILLGASLGAIVLSGILSEQNVKGIRLRVRAIGAAYVDEVTRLELVLSKEGGGQAFAFRVHERPHGIWEPWKSWRKASPQVLVAKIPMIEAGSARKVAARRFDQRGLARLARLELSTTYPFALLHKTLDVEVDLEVAVRPRRIAVASVLVEPRSRQGEGDASRTRGHGLDVFGLRERLENEDERRLHALRSLALGRDVVIETTGIERTIAWIGVALEGGDAQAVERTLEHAQAALLEWDRRNHAVGLCIGDRCFEPGTAAIDGLLDALARAEAVALSDFRRMPSAWLVASGAAVPSAADVAWIVSPKGTLTRRSA